jgi:hypothetical protein
MEHLPNEPEKPPLWTDEERAALSVFDVSGTPSEVTPRLCDEHGPGEEPRRAETLVPVVAWLCVTFLLALLIIRLT